MTVNELHAKINAAKALLNNEIVRIKTSGEADWLNYREIGDRLDLIHEVERIGIRNLGERDVRKITRMLVTLDELQASRN